MTQRNTKKSAPRVGLQINVTDAGVRTVKVSSNTDRKAGFGFICAFCRSLNN